MRRLLNSNREDNYSAAIHYLTQMGSTIIMFIEFRSIPALLKAAITDDIFFYISSNVLYEGKPLQLFKESVAKQNELKNVQKVIM